VECVFNAADILDGSSVRITPCNFLHQGGNAMSIGIESRTDVQDAPRTIRPGPSPTPAIAKRDDLIEAPRP
jgi:hypothetical protein